MGTIGKYYEGTRYGNPKVFASSFNVFRFFCIDAQRGKGTLPPTGKGTPSGKGDPAGIGDLSGKRAPLSKDAPGIATIVPVSFQVFQCLKSEQRDISA